ncbi:Lumican Keratan sulfate proteoglycan lumican [Channa argus]|uniref:Lumican n=1 Tax=Channa argus TaxID=215402 RepID=A0A6G1QSI0_CHAAH|nr:Lumican Keratan sulfate proteoglycan lumican [Channa argus]
MHFTIRDFQFLNTTLFLPSGPQPIAHREREAQISKSMFPLRVPLLTILVRMALCQYEDYYEPYVGLGPSVRNCDQECECPINFPSAMYCDGRNLKYVPVVPSGIMYLYLQNNQIEEIKAGVFDNVTTGLRWLVLDHNQLTNAKIAKGTLDKLTGLEKLFFSHNNLTEPIIPPSKSLDELKIMHNKLSKFPSGLLTDKENLTSINLQHNQLTSDAIAGAFKGPKKLLSLDVSFNKLKKLPAGVPSSLEILYADYNDIDSIAAGYLNKLPSLQYLRMSNNKLADAGIPSGAFNVSSLVELDLSFNKLQSIPEINEKLEQLYLQANEINKIDLASFCKFTGPLNYSRLKHLRLDANNVTHSNMPHDSANCLRQASDIMFE